MNENDVRVTVDLDADAAYVQLLNTDVVASRQVSDEVIVDLDVHGMVVGIEFLRVDAEIPFPVLVKDFHVHSTVVEQLRSLRPSIGGRLQAMSEGSTTTTRTSTLTPA